MKTKILIPVFGSYPPDIPGGTHIIKEAEGKDYWHVTNEAIHYPYRDRLPLYCWLKEVEVDTEDLKNLIN